MNTINELKQLEMSADAFSLELAENSWYDLMHWHPDIYGTGNKNCVAREACLKISLRYLSTAMENLTAWSQQSQCWFLAHQNDSAEDSIYVHTPNPNHQNFPYLFEGVTWGVVPPSWLAETFPEPRYIHGTSVFNEKHLHWVIENRPHALVNHELVRLSAALQASRLASAK